MTLLAVCWDGPEILLTVDGQLINGNVTFPARKLTTVGDITYGGGLTYGFVGEAAVAQALRPVDSSQPLAAVLG